MLTNLFVGGETGDPPSLVKGKKHKKKKKTSLNIPRPEVIWENLHVFTVGVKRLYYKSPWHSSFYGK